MLWYVTKRLALIIPSLLGLVLLTFVLLCVIPHDPAQVMAGEAASPERLAEMRQRYGLDLGLPIQLWIYLGKLAHGDFGISLFSGRPILHEVLERLAPSLELSVTALILAVLLGVPLGTLAATHHNRWLDRLIRLGTVASLGIAAFWIGIVLQTIFALELEWLPLRGQIDPDAMPPRMSGFLTLDSLFSLRWDCLVSSVQHLLLPTFTLAMAGLPTIARFARSSVLDTLSQDFVNYANASGVGKHRLVWIYVMRNSLTAVMTQIGLLFGSLMGSAVAVESIFDWPGLGGYAVNAVLSFDTRAIMGVTLVMGLIYAVVNLIVDCLLAWLDPRIRARLT